MELQLLVGLGNPGDRYVETRHNVGFMVLDQLASVSGSGFRHQSRLHGLLAESGSGSQRLRLLKPQTYMNESGRSIRAALDWFGLDASQILVLVDDMDLPLGRLRLRACGSAGGHNGLRSTIAHLGTEAFARLRIGIGAPSSDPQERRDRTVSHVLGRFSEQERPILSGMLDEVCQGIALIRSQGLERASNRLNSVRLDPQPS